LKETSLEIDPNFWKNNVMKATPMVVKQWLQGRTNLSLSACKHYEMHRSTYVPHSFEER
jgi:hypothetical protein